MFHTRIQHGSGAARVIARPRNVARAAAAVAWALAAAVLSGCRDAAPVNSPYARGAAQENTLYSAFTQRSPKYLDPARSYSSDETPYTYNIYEPLYGYHYLKRPYALVPRAAAALTQPRYVDAQGATLPQDAPGPLVAESVYDIRIRSGILFAPHPAFARDGDHGGNSGWRYYPMTADALADKYAIPDFPETGTRELVADDYVYAIRRLASPRVASPIYSLMAEHIVGMAEYGERLRARDQMLRAGLAQGVRDLPWLDLRDDAIGASFDGVQALDAHTLRIRVKGKYPQFQYWLAMTFLAPIPWEADRFYAQPGMAARDLSLNTWPVGTGPYMLVEFAQNHRHVLARNPHFRGEPYPCAGEPEDAARGLLADCGKPTPFLDRIVFSIEKEAIPLQGKFLQGYYDIPQVERGEYGVAMQVAAGDAPEKAELYAERGFQLPTTVETQSWYLGFNWLDPVVGAGATPEQALRNRRLRHAISIALNWEEYVAIFENSQAEVAHGPVPPGVLGYRPDAVNASVYDVVDGKPVRKSLAEAKRLLAQAGYPDGRDAVSGQPLVLYFDAMSGMTGASPTFDWLRRQLGRLGVQLDVRATDYNRFQEKMRSGTAQLFMWGWLADYPDAENFLFLLYGANAKAVTGGENAANYASAEFDALFAQMRFLEDGPQKEALIARMVAVVQRDAPWMFGHFPKSGGAYQQWVRNAKPTQMVRNTLQYVRIDPSLRAQKIAEWNAPIRWPLAFVPVLLTLAVWPAWRARQRRERQRPGAPA